MLTASFFSSLSINRRRGITTNGNRVTSHAPSKLHFKHPKMGPLNSVILLLSVLSLLMASAQEAAQAPILAPESAQIQLPPPIHFIFRQTPCTEARCEGKDAVECLEGREVWSKCFAPWVERKVDR